MVCDADGFSNGYSLRGGGGEDTRRSVGVAMDGRTACMIVYHTFPVRLNGRPVLGRPVCDENLALREDRHAKRVVRTLE